MNLFSIYIFLSSGIFINRHSSNNFDVKARWDFFEVDFFNVEHFLSFRNGYWNKLTQLVDVILVCQVEPRWYSEVIKIEVAQNLGIAEKSLVFLQTFLRFQKRLILSTFMRQRVILWQTMSFGNSVVISVWTADLSSFQRLLLNHFNLRNFHSVIPQSTNSDVRVESGVLLRA